MEIYLKSHKTNGLICQIKKQGNDVVITEIWNRYLYSDFCKKILFDSSDVETQLLTDEHPEHVALSWVKHWDASYSSKNEFVEQGKKAISNIHQNIFQ